MRRPIISFVTVNLDNHVGLEKTLGALSVIRKKYGNTSVEIVLVDGNSHADDQVVIKSYESEIDVLIIEKDEGIYDAMNKGMARTSGKLVNFMNSGDVPLYDGINQFIQNVDRFDVVHVGQARWVGKKRYGLFENKISKFWLKMPNHQSMFFPGVFIKNNVYNTGYPVAADLHFKLTAYKNYKFVSYHSEFVECETGGVSHTIKSLATLLKRAKEVRSIALDINGIFSANINFIKYLFWHGAKLVICSRK